MTIAPVVVTVLIGLAGVLVVGLALLSAIETLVLPRGGNTRTALAMMTLTRKTLLALSGRRSSARRERALAMVAPVALLLMPIAWLVQIWFGYALMFRASGVAGAWEPFRLAGSSILTLGFATGTTAFQDVLTFSAATLGLGVLTLLIAYLPTMYTAFSERETQVSLLAVRAGTPPTARVFMERYAAIGMGSDDMGDVAELLFVWEEWFAQLRETHTTLAALPLFRSSNPAQSWITAAGTVLDTASLLHSTVVAAPRTAAALCIRSGFLALRDIASIYGLPFDADPAPDDAISIGRAEYDSVYDQMAAAGIELREREQAWRDFAGWRVNYDTPLLELAAMLEAPQAPWTSDRPPLNGHSRMGRPTSRR